MWILKMFFWGMFCIFCCEISVRSTAQWCEAIDSADCRSSKTFFLQTWKKMVRKHVKREVHGTLYLYEVCVLIWKDWAPLPLPVRWTHVWIHVFFPSRKYRGRNMVPCGSALEAAERESRSSFDHTAELQIPSNDRQRLENHGICHSEKSICSVYL